MFDEPIEAVHLAQHEKRLFDLGVVHGGLRQIGERIRHDAADLPSLPAAEQSLKQSADRLFGTDGEVGVVDQIDEQIHLRCRFADHRRLRGAIEAGDRDQRQHHRLIRRYLQTVADRGDRRGVGRVDENEMSQQGRRGDQLFRLALLAPQLRDRKRDGAAFQIADVDRIQFPQVTDDEALAAPGAAMQSHGATVLVVDIEHDDRLSAVARFGNRADQQGRIDLAVLQIRGQLSAIARRSKPLSDRKRLRRIE